MTNEEIILKFSEEFKKSGWFNLFKTILFSSEFDNILTILKSNVEEGKRFTPALKDIFRAFNECPYDDLKVIIVGMDPYPKVGIADGIAFSNSYNPPERTEASLRFILNNINDTVYNLEKDPKTMDKDLKRWSNQGVLLLNVGLTVEINKIGSHIKLWNPFIAFLFDMLGKDSKKYIWAFLGNAAKEYEKLVPDTHIKLFASHPASAAYQKLKTWDSNNLFNNINDHLDTKIIW